MGRPRCTSHRYGSLACASVILAACGPGVRSLDADRQPLATLNVRITEPLWSDAPRDALRVSLVWSEGDFENFSPLHTNDGLVIPLGSQEFATLPPNQLQVHIEQMPDVLDLLRISDVRFGLGAVVLHNDNHGDEAIRIYEPGRFVGNAELLEQIEPVLGASISPCRDESGTYVAFIEGDLAASSDAPLLVTLALLGCTNLRVGFSVVDLGYTGGNITSCAVLPIDSPIDVALEDSDDMRLLLTDRGVQGHVGRTLPETEPPPTAVVECTSDLSLEFYEPGPNCPLFTQYHLLGWCYGCLDDPLSAGECPPSDCPADGLWDLRANPPVWWPCP